MKTDFAKLNRAVVCGYDTVIEMSHRFIAGNPNIDTTLCGMSKPSDIASTLANYAKPLLEEKQRQAIKDALISLSPEGVGFCTACQYCLPCPQGVNIPLVMEGVYLHRHLQQQKFALEHLNYCNDPANNYVPYKSCNECGECEAKCTQNLDIIEEIKYARTLIGELPKESQ